MNWGQFKDHACYLFLAGTVVASRSLRQDVLVGIIFFNVKNQWEHLGKNWNVSVKTCAYLVWFMSCLGRRNVTVTGRGVPSGVGLIYMSDVVVGPGVMGSYAALEVRSSWCHKLNQASNPGGSSFLCYIKAKKTSFALLLSHRLNSRVFIQLTQIYQKQHKPIITINRAASRILPPSTVMRKKGCCIILEPEE